MDAGFKEDVLLTSTVMLTMMAFFRFVVGALQDFEH